jgi:Sap, sulfolipid-1-addressing protein
VDITSLVALALAASVYPTLLAGVILILSQPRPLRMLFGFLFGGVTISMVAGIAIIRALESSGAVSTTSRSTQPIVSIAAGVVSLLVARGISTGRLNGGLRKHKRRRPDPDTDVPARSSLASRTLARGSITMAFVAGVVLNLPGVWYLEALTEISKAKPSTASALLQLLLFNVIMFALVELPIVAYIVEPQGAADLVKRATEWGHTHSRKIAIVVATVLGVWLIVKGIINL